MIHTVRFDSEEKPRTMRYTGRFLKPFQAFVLFLFPLKTSGNQRFSGVSRSYRKRTLCETGYDLEFVIETKFSREYQISQESKAFYQTDQIQNEVVRK